MKTEETLDYWLEEYSANKKLLNRLTFAKEEIIKNNNDYAIGLNEHEILVLLEGLTKTLQSNKESIIDCSYNLIINKNNNKIKPTEQKLTEQKPEIISTQKKQANVIIKTETDFIQKFLAVLDSSNKIKIEFCCDLPRPIERITLIAIIRDVANISIKDAKNAFDNRDIDRIDFLLDSEHLRYNYNKLKDYIKYGGKLILQSTKQ